MFAELDIIALTHDIIEYGLNHGSKGTIVHLYKNGEAFEVEFIDPEGYTTAIATLTPKDVRLVWRKRLHKNITYSDYSMSNTKEWSWAPLKYLRSDRTSDFTQNFAF